MSFKSICCISFYFLQIWKGETEDKPGVRFATFQTKWSKTCIFPKNNWTLRLNCEYWAMWISAQVIRTSNHIFELYCYHLRGMLYESGSQPMVKWPEVPPERSPSAPQKHYIRSLQWLFSCFLCHFCFTSFTIVLINVDLYGFTCPALWSKNDNHQLRLLYFTESINTMLLLT